MTAHPLAEAWAEGQLTDSLSLEAERVLRTELRSAYFERYVSVTQSPGMSEICATTPSLAMCDDHDIHDGWGSLAAARLDDPVGRVVFETAREMCRAFQMRLGAGEVSPLSLRAVADNLGWCLRAPGVRVIAPDLRSQRRPNQVMDWPAWAALERELARAFGPDAVPLQHAHARHALVAAGMADGADAAHEKI